MAAPAQALRLVMFDLDGTLIDTAPEIADAVNDTLAQCGLPLVSQQQVRDWIGHGTRTLLIAALASAQGRTVQEIGADPDLPRIAGMFDGHYQNRCGSSSQPYPHVVEVLHSLRAHGVHLAVVTNKEGRYTDTVLRAHQLHTRFGLVISGDTLATKKPDPAGIARCLAHFRVAADEALFVGDSSIDAATARNAGVAIWLLPYGYNMGQPIAACQPDRVIPDMRAVLTLL
jgi:phosphoglycolate phosphatase